MSELAKFLEGVEVEWKKLGEVGEFFRGRRFVKTDIISEGTPCIHYGEMYTHYGIWADKSKSFVSPELASKLRKATKGDVVFVAAGETIEDIGKGTAWLGNEDVVIHDACFFYKSSLNPKYVAYFSRTKSFHDQIKNSISSGKISAINSKGLEKVIIPIHPVEIQSEIVRILDTFTELTTELTAELTARKKQYEYYRDKLLNFSELNRGGVIWTSLGEIGKFIRGGGLQKKDFTETGVGCIHYGQIYTYYGTYTDKTKTSVSEEFAKKARMAKHGDLIIATTSENDEDVCKAVAWLGDEDIAISSDACFYRHSLNPKYVAYFFQTEQFQKQKRPFITGTKVRRVNADDLAKIKIPVPFPEEQEWIVSILDKFDTLTTSISEGLPKEIAQRKQQYEYYRDTLLTFPKEHIMA
ncbi:restriction endonuclease subunit S [Spirosoma sp. HMF3257]|uniref:Restriction endonuclease subunit S n=1 Tax=Spirosoma telluris TaxID=2183553 RepID=A0A327NKZ6_9BACT|nr:restriction endonuclease subunit S [Spirosoma telluris]RAI75425.1 restriction endonuclease subunit S [Spirosoma telluris]